MVRLSFANGYTPHTFYNKLLKVNDPLWTRDIDRSQSPKLLPTLHRFTGVSEDALKRLTIADFVGQVFEHVPEGGNLAWLLPLGVYHRTRSRDGMQYCPLCLQMDQAPYFRKTWRLSFYVMCEYHLCLMHGHCSSCKSPIAFHRIRTGCKYNAIFNPKLSICSYCGFDLANSPATYVNWPDAIDLSLLLALISFFDIGGWDCGYKTPCSGVLFFSGLCALMSFLIGRHGKGVRAHLRQELGISEKERLPRRASFEKEDAYSRFIILLYTLHLTRSWPHHFLRLCRLSGVSRSNFSGHLGDLPFWLADILDTYLDR